MAFKLLLTALAAGALAAAPPRLAAAQAAGGTGIGDLILRQTASDRMNLELDQVVQAAIARGASERKNMSAGEPIKRYLEKLEDETIQSARAPDAAGEGAAPTSADDLAPLVDADLKAFEKRQDALRAAEAAAEDIPPLVEDELRRWEQRQAERERIDAYAAAKANGVTIKILTARSIENWGRLVVIVPAGEVIENDPMDVAHARLEDLSRRREELQAELRTKPTSDSMRSILRELAGIDRQINSTIYQITGVVWFDRGGKGSVCHPKAVKGRPVAWYNCDYWAEGVPFVVDPHGENIIVDRVRIEVDEGPRGFRKASIAYYTRPHGQPPSDAPSAGASGDFRYLADGTVQLVTKEVDDAGEERERVFPIEVSTDEGTGLIPGFSNHGPFKLKFRRDPKAYITWEEAQAISRGVVSMGSAKPAESNAPPSDSDWVVPLTEPQAAPAAPPRSPPPNAPPSDSDWVVPLTAPQDAPPRPPPPPPPPPSPPPTPSPEPEDPFELAPLVSP